MFRETFMSDSFPGNRNNTSIFWRIEIHRIYVKNTKLIHCMFINKKTGLPYPLNLFRKHCIL